LVTVGTAARQTGLSAKAVRLCVRVVVTDQGAVPADLVILGLGACVRKVHVDAMRKALLGEEDTRQGWRGLRGSCEAAGDGFGGWRRALHGR